MGTASISRLCLLRACCVRCTSRSVCLCVRLVKERMCLSFGLWVENYAFGSIDGEAISEVRSRVGSK